MVVSESDVTQKIIQQAMILFHTKLVTNHMKSGTPSPCKNHQADKHFHLHLVIATAHLKNIFNIMSQPFLMLKLRDKIRP